MTVVPDTADSLLQDLGVVSHCVKPYSRRCQPASYLELGMAGVTFGVGDINAPYTYQRIDDKTKKKAVKELKENCDQVHSHIASLRRWLLSMPHIENCRTGQQV